MLLGEHFESILLFQKNLSKTIIFYKVRPQYFYFLRPLLAQLKCSFSLKQLKYLKDIHMIQVIRVMTIPKELVMT